ncbi:MAG: two-component system, sensor histidine kinase and response regulator [Candidatus Binatota bacterium]|nr:two-component system, sensor histidine kinase and response regulator [Candidatus Binatota bacterium]
MRVATKLGAGIGIGLVALLIIGAVAQRSTQDLIATNDWVVHSHQAIESLQEILALVTESEASSRGYVITGDADHAARYRAAATRLRDAIPRFAVLVRDNPIQERRARELDAIVRRRVEFARRVIEVRDRSGFEAGADLVRTGEGERLMDEVRRLVARMIAEEQRLLGERIEASVRSADAAHHASVVTTAVAIGVTVLFWVVLTGGLGRAVRGLAEGAEKVGSGDLGHRIESHRRDELGLLATTFNRMAEDLQERDRLLDLANRRLSEELARRQRVEEELRDSETKFRKIFENAPTIVSINALDDGRYLEVNPQFEKTLGYPGNEVLGRTAGELGLWTDAPVLRRILERLKADGTVQGYEARFRARSGDVVEGVFSAEVLPVGGRPCIVSFVHDVSAERRAQVDLARARDQALDASRAKADFLASMSHEIRTPLNGVIGMIGLLMDTPMSREQMEFAGTARASAEALLAIINDILDFSKVEAGKLELEPIAFDLRAVVESLVEIFSPAAEAKDVELVIRFAPDTPQWVIADPGRIRQVLTNLLGNALKFTHAGHVLVDVQAESTADGEATIRFAVEDTGIGIPRAKLAAIFDRFTQADSSTTRHYGGTGLGLAISKQLVERMGGDIGVESEPGRGSTFHFRLRVPLTRSPVATPVSPGELNGARVLVVDDNEVNRRILTEQLLRWGMRVESAASGREALAAASRGHREGDPFRLALLDHQMPEMDGETLARAIKSDGRLGAMVLLLLTSAGRKGAAEQMADAGLAAYLLKPVRPSALLDAIATACGAAEPPAAVPEVGLPPPSASDGAPRARVLLVEDNLVNQKVAKKMLEKIGCRVDLAADGHEGVEMAMRFPYDVVFMDCQMPVMDGYDATRQIRREEPPGRRVPIVAMTAHAMTGERKRCIDAGMDDYLAKPIDVSELRKTVDAWAGRSGIAPSDDSMPVDLERLRKVIDDPQVLRELFDTYLGEIDRFGRDLRVALAAGSAVDVARLAHGCLGASATLGAQAAARLLADLETASRAGRLDEAARIAADVERALERTGEYLRTIR